MSQDCDIAISQQIVAHRREKLARKRDSIHVGFDVPDVGDGC
jgi:hypothetical protein